MKKSQRTIKKRIDFYSIIFESLQELLAGKESELQIFNLWGGPGSGKTYALDKIKSMSAELEYVKVFGPFDVSQQDHMLFGKILAEISKAGQPDKKLVLLDNLKSTIANDVADTSIYNLEEKLISPIISTGDAIIVITSLHQIQQWRSVEVRTRNKAILIPPADDTVLKTLVKNSGLDYETAYKKTLGHPKVFEWLSEAPDDIEDEELNRIATDFFLHGLDAETKKIARIMSLSYNFNVPAYQKAVEVIGLRSNTYFSDLTKIKELSSTGLIFYESETGTYHFSDPILRRLLARFYRQEFPEIAAKIHSVLADLVIKEASLPNSLSSHFLNAIYHQLWNSKYSGFSFPIWLDNWFRDMEHSWLHVNWNQANRDIKKDLASTYILAEIKDLTDVETYNKIIFKICPTRRNKK